MINSDKRERGTKSPPKMDFYLTAHQGKSCLEKDHEFTFRFKIDISQLTTTVNEVDHVLYIKLWL